MDEELKDENIKQSILNEFKIEKTNPKEEKELNESNTEPNDNKNIKINEDIKQQEKIKVNEAKKEGEDDLQEELDDIKKLEMMQSESQQKKVHKDENSIILKNITDNTSKDDILRYFKACGQIIDVKILRNAKNRSFFAYIEFKKQNSVELALQLSHTVLKGREIIVTKKQKLKKKNKRN